MREIEFRGKCIDTGDWIYGDLITDGEGAAIVTEARIEYQEFPWVKRVQRVWKRSVGQYTGLKDKNDTGIYEGDIVKMTYSKIINVEYDEYSLGVLEHEEISGHFIGEIITIPSKGVCLKNPLHYSEDEGEWSISKQYKDVAGYRTEVIGNVFEHSHLLEGEANE